MQVLEDGNGDFDRRGSIRAEMCINGDRRRQGSTHDLLVLVSLQLLWSHRGGSHFQWRRVVDVVVVVVRVARCDRPHKRTAGDAMGAL